MNPMIVTKATGAKTMPIGMVVTAPECEMTGSQLLGAMGEEEGGSILLANLLSAFTAHERCGVHLYRTAAEMTQFPEWREKYEEFLAQTEEHVSILSNLITELGGDPMYVSPQARVAEFMDAKLMEAVLLEGSMDSLTRELTMLEAVLLAEQKCHSDWQLLKRLAEQFPTASFSSVVQDAVARVEEQEDEHVQWAQQTWLQTLLVQLAPGAPAG